MGNIYTKKRSLEFMCRQALGFQPEQIDFTHLQHARGSRAADDSVRVGDLLSKVLFSPRQKAVDAILRYSAETAREIGFKNKGLSV